MPNMPRDEEYGRALSWTKEEKTGPAKPGLAEEARFDYERVRDLPGLALLWPHEIADRTCNGQRHVMACLRRELGRERRRATAGSGRYDLNRHLALYYALKTEQAAFARTGRRLVSERRRPSQPAQNMSAR